MLAAPPTLGPGRLVCVDGPAGSGKTTLADALGATADDVVVIHCDELLQGWRGLPGLAATVADLVAPLATGGRAGGRRWDWLADDWAETHPVEPGGLLVLEGVGSWSPAIADLVGALVWVEAGLDLRLDRGHGPRRRGDARPLAALAGRGAAAPSPRSAPATHADLVVSTDS